MWISVGQKWHPNILKAIGFFFKNPWWSCDVIIYEIQESQWMILYASKYWKRTFYFGTEKKRSLSLTKYPWNNEIIVNVYRTCQLYPINTWKKILVEDNCLNKLKFFSRIQVYLTMPVGFYGWCLHFGTPPTPPSIWHVDNHTNVQYEMVFYQLKLKKRILR